MKVEIKKVKKERQSGFYKVKLMDGSLSIGQYSLNTKKWYLCGNETAFYDNLFNKIHENPILSENEEPKPEFEPIELSLTIESKEELHELWHRMNIAPKKVNELYKDNLSYNFWQRLNEIMEERNIKP